MTNGLTIGGAVIVFSAICICGIFLLLLMDEKKQEAARAQDRAREKERRASRTPEEVRRDEMKAAIKHRVMLGKWLPNATDQELEEASYIAEDEALEMVRARLTEKRVARLEDRLSELEGKE